MFSHFIEKKQAFRRNIQGILIFNWMLSFFKLPRIQKLISMVQGTKMKEKGFVLNKPYQTILLLVEINLEEVFKLD